MNGAGKIVMECIIETKASMILQFIDGLRGDLQITKPECHVTEFTISWL
jgi:hypothetical protein